MPRLVLSGQPMGRLRRGARLTVSATTFTPLSLSPLAWFKADALALSDAAAVATWADSSGNGRDATQATGVNQPIYKTGIVNGKPVVRFDGSNDSLATATFTLPQEWSAFGVAVQTDTAGTYAIASTDQVGGVLRHAQMLRYVGANAQSIAFNTVSTSFVDQQATVSAGTFYVVSAVRGATTVQTWLNGTSDGSTATTGTPNSGTSGLAVGLAPGPFFFKGDIAEVIVFGTALSASDRQSVQSYLGTKYGITVS